MMLTGGDRGGQAGGLMQATPLVDFAIDYFPKGVASIGTKAGENARYPDLR